MTNEGIIFIVDDDPAVRKSLRVLLESVNFEVRDYESAKAFLAGNIGAGRCLIANIRMPEMSGLELQEGLARRAIALPVIIVTGRADVSLAVRAMQAGAADFIEKPFDDDILLASLRRTLDASDAGQNPPPDTRAANELISRLTPREWQVLQQLVAGRSNKLAAFELSISSRTIEIHRARIMDKLNARSLSDLVRMALAARVPPIAQH